MLQIGTSNNPIGVYGPSVKAVADKVNNGMAPKDLFDEVSVFLYVTVVLQWCCSGVTVC
jgi:formaldehyde-activating enzyme involved in methanogenesis